LSPEGVTRTSAEATLHYNWSVVNSIEVADNFVFFFTGINEGHFVPRTAFEYDEDFRSFVRQARRLREDADRYPLAEAADVEASEGIQPARDVTGTRARPGSPPTAP
jgi:hypothetical protein